ncbi:MAG TPA: YafY family protein [Candidatus Limnocylindrales bacterium]|nr:YafY family protein [Candidatus Limnocylindrales bacterium]
MRASRLLSLLLLLQTRGGMTAAELADELEVSVRTIHRDVEALGAAGIPVYAERGPHGGIRLIDGYRTRLTGMTGEEADALFLSGLPGAAAELGLGTVVASSRLKVLAALPAELRGRASRLLERFHLDAAGWFRPGDTVPWLATIAEAVWEGLRIDLEYDRGDRTVQRRVDPLGIVLKAGNWYLVAGHEGQLRTYRVSRVTEVTLAEERAVRPDGFDLSTYWTESIAAYERDTPRIEVTLRARRGAARWLEDVLDAPALSAAVELPDPEPETWRTMRITLDWPREVAGRLLALGGAVEVLAPPELRSEIAALATEAAARYAEPPARVRLSAEG